jgi:hypothetical protein
MHAYVFNADTPGYRSNARSPSAAQRRQHLHTSRGVGQIGAPSSSSPHGTRSPGRQVVNKNSSRGFTSALQGAAAGRTSPPRPLSAVLASRRSPSPSRGNIF